MAVAYKLLADDSANCSVFSAESEYRREESAN